MSFDLSRRDFLKKAAVGAAGLGALSMGLTGAMAEPAATDGVQWDAEYDVVVLGYGFAGSAAALAAADAGARVLLSEKAPLGGEGGNSKAAGQALQATDDKEKFHTYLKQLMGHYENWDAELLETYADGAYHQYEWLVNTLGLDPEQILPSEPWEMPNQGGFAGAPATMMGRSGYLMNWAEFPEYEGSDHCFCFFISGKEFDSSLYLACKAAVEKRDNIQLWFDAPGKRLIRDSQGKVLGVRILKEGTAVNVRALGGVVLATGGFEANKNMIASYLQRPYCYVRAAIYNEGDGVKMAQAVGADLWHMSNGAAFSWGYQPEGRSSCLSVNSAALKAGVLVGPGGTRFMNETASSRHGRIDIGGSWIMMPTPCPAFIVTDSQGIHTKFCSSFSEDNADEIADGWVYQGATLEELAAQIGVDAQNLTATVDKFNAACDAGVDADYGRPADTMTALKTGPYYAIEIGPTMLNTQGGPVRNKYAQVLDVDGNPIPGLFSAGELGALWSDMYNGGGNIAEGCIFGRIAGANAAANAKGEFEGAPWVDPDAVVEEVQEKPVETATVSYVDGTYVGTGKGMNGKFQVTVTIAGGQVTDIQVGENSETQGIGSNAIEQMPGRIIQAQSVNVDGVAGATVTSDAIKEAVADALSQALS